MLFFEDDTWETILDSLVLYARLFVHERLAEKDWNIRLKVLYERFLGRQLRKRYVFSTISTKCVYKYNKHVRFEPDNLYQKQGPVFFKPKSVLRGFIYPLRALVFIFLICGYWSFKWWSRIGFMRQGFDIWNSSYVVIWTTHDLCICDDSHVITHVKPFSNLAKRHETVLEWRICI